MEEQETQLGPAFGSWNRKYQNKKQIELTVRDLGALSPKRFVCIQVLPSGLRVEDRDRL